MDVLFAPEVAVYALAHRWPASLTTAGGADRSARLTGTAGHLDAMVAETDAAGVARLLWAKSGSHDEEPGRTFRTFHFL